MAAIMTLSDSPASDGREWAARHQAAGPGAINAAAREGFEHGFLSVPFEVQLLECETNPIAPLVKACGVDDNQGVWQTIGFKLTGRWVGEPLTLRINAFGRPLASASLGRM